ncbi:Heparinase II/III-like protein [Photobacterium marinum]|uniref:Heparinase II/III-like protein n=1 Tax=Photobacterium marinum TaxID=1056511 RepID=L8J8K7_9GAMM|nr:heparinase II/III family protein [Photobacterium marinum]ELR63767.1 Heparinase II/III-like protein [Photobacterium marinum]
MNKVHRLFHTVKHLKPVQILNRLQRKFNKIQLCDEGGEPRPKSQQWIRYELLPSPFIGGKKFKFLNHEGEVSDWNDERQEKLWLYNLHYFDDLNAEQALNRKASLDNLIDKWIDENSPLTGNGWEPYPQSLRIVNWVKYFLSIGEPSSKVLTSIYQQANVLAQDLEYHLLGNHLFANAKALVFAGCFFDGDRAESWLDTGLKILDKEIPEQILQDGGNFELSPMYHNIILADMLDLYNLANTYNLVSLNHRKGQWKLTIEKMLHWATAMSHPDGDVSFFNDSAKGIAARQGCLHEYAVALGIEVRQKRIPAGPELISDYLKDSGYFVAQNDKIKAILDIAKVGPDYIPGHAHADTLSFELSAFGQRVFVNGGTSIYGLSEERLRQRKTESHNTVEVDGQDSSEVWSGFRVARRAYPAQPVINEQNGKLQVSCSHNGYKRLSGKVTHSRNWLFTDEQLVITDKVDGSFTSAVAHYHIHPDVEVTQVGDIVELTLITGERLFVESNGKLEIARTTWHPEFGISIPNKKLVITFTEPQLEFILRY